MSSRNGDVGLGVGLGIDAVLLAVAGHRLAIDVAGGVLGAHHVGGDLFRGVPLAQRADDLHLLVAHAVGA